MDSCQFLDIRNAIGAPRTDWHVMEGIHAISAIPPRCVYRAGHRAWRNYLRALNVAPAAVDKDKGATADDPVRAVSTENQIAPMNLRTV